MSGMRRIGLVAVVVAFACGQPSPTAPAPAPAPAPVAPGPAAPARTCPAPFEVPLPYADPFVDDAAKLPAVTPGAWWTTPMDGPLTAIPSSCNELRRLDPVPPFEMIVHCSTGKPKRPLGPDNQARHLLVLRTAHGWWTYELVHETWPHGADEEPKVADVDSLVARDLVGDPGAEIAAVTEVGPPGGAKFRVAHVCGFTGGPAPVCAPIRVAAGGPFHGAGAALYRLSLACDGTLELVGWQGGSPVGLVHARYTLPFR